MIKGIDVSSWQGVVDYRKVKASGVSFVIIRAGYGREVSQKDNCFEQNYSAAKAAGLDVGAYWYSYADSAEDAVREAKACMEVIKGKKFEYHIYFDLEEQSQFAKGKSFCDSVIKAFCGELEKNGYLAGLYCSTYYLNNFVSNNVAGKYPLWVAQYNYRCTYTANKYGIWQYSSEGRVNGISDNVDMDYCYTDYPTIVKNGGYNGYKKPVTAEKKTVTQLAKEVIEGKWSNGDERKQKLTEAGYNYSAVQKKVNELCEKMKIDEIAQEVIQGKWGNGEERQQKLTDETYIRSNPEWEYAGLYYDEGISGTSQNGRNGLLALISDCEKRKIDLVLTKSISRFARNTTDCIEITRKLLRLGVRILFEKENIDTGSMESELMLSILGSLAESESVSISENEKWSIRKRFENDTYVIPVPPYGYKNENGRMVIVPEQAAIVKEIFDDILSGKTSSQIAENLNQRGIVTVRGGRWRLERITELIANEKYVGDALFQKTYTDSSFTRHRNHGVCNQYLITEHHEPIVSRKVFDRANEIIKLRRKGKCDTKKYQNRYGFSGKIICGECGSAFKRRIHYTVSGSYTAWCCKKHLQNITACSMKYVADDSLKAAFLIMINKLIFGRKYVLTPLLRKLQREGRNKRLKECDDLISKNIESQHILLKLLSSGMLDGDIYTQESTRLKNEFDRLQKEKSLISAENREEKITELEKLIKFMGENNCIEEYSDTLFLEFVDHIKIVSRHEAEFHLKCGLILTEELI